MWEGGCVYHEGKHGRAEGGLTRNNQATGRGRCNERRLVPRNTSVSHTHTDSTGISSPGSHSHATRKCSFIDILILLDLVRFDWIGSGQVMGVWIHQIRSVQGRTEGEGPSWEKKNQCSLSLYCERLCNHED